MPTLRIKLLINLTFIRNNKKGIFQGLNAFEHTGMQTSAEGVARRDERTVSNPFIAHRISYAP